MVLSVMHAEEKFIQEYLEEIVRLRELWIENALPVYKRFLKEGYDPYNPSYMVDLAKAELVLSVNRKPDSTEVTTNGFGECQRTRYTLVPHGESFAISLIEWECGLCCGSEKPKSNCGFCGGTGWQRLPFRAPSSR